MTNLFYPSVTVWYQKRNPARGATSDTAHAGPSRLHGHDHPFSILSTPLLDSFFPDPPSPMPSYTPGSIWDSPGETGWNGTRIPKRSRRRREGEETLYLRVGWTDVGRVMRHSTGQPAGHGEWGQKDDTLLDSIREMVERWEGDYPGSREHCVRALIPDETNSGLAVATGACLMCSSHPSSQCHVGRPAVVAGIDDGSYHHAHWFMRISHSSADSFHARWSSALRGISEKSDGARLIDQSIGKIVTDPSSGEWRVSVSQHTLSHLHPWTDRNSTR